MSSSNIPRQYGDEYQQLVFWKYALMMLNDEYEIESIGYEYGKVKSFDDIVINFSKPQNFRDSTISSKYIQVKFHMRNDDLFKTFSLIDPKFINASKNSLLDNVVAAYKNKDVDFKNSIFTIYSVWEIAQDDELYSFIDNIDRKICIDKLFDAKNNPSKIKKIRDKYCEVLGIDENDLKKIMRQITVESGKESLKELEVLINQKLENQGLQFILGSSHLNPYTQLIQKLNQAGHTQFEKDFLIQQLQAEGLYTYKNEKKELCIRSFVRSNDNQMYQFDNILKLEDYFYNRFLKEEYKWETEIYDSLCKFFKENCVENKEYRILIDANQTIAFMAGRIMDIKESKDIVPVQRTEKGIIVWDKKDNNCDHQKAIFTEHIINDSAKDVAIAIGFSRDIINDVKEYLDGKNNIRKIINIRLKTTDSSNVIDGSHAWQLANQIKNEIDKRELREKQGILHVFMACPNAVVFILARYSLSFGKIQLYEYDFLKENICTYYPTLMLHTNI